MQRVKTEIRIAWHLIKTNIAASVEQRTAFALQVIGMMVNDLAFVIVWGFFFTSFGTINGWSTLEFVAMMGFNAVGFGLVGALMDGAAHLPRYVDNGSFDSILLSPRNLYLRILTSRSGITQFGDFFFGVILLVIYFIYGDLDAMRVIASLSLLVPICLIFANVLLVTNLIAFWVPGSFLLAKNLFEAFLAPSLYPGGLFQGALRVLFIWVIPSLAVGALPVELISNFSWKTYGTIWFLGIAWTILAGKLLNFAVRRYESGNLIGARV